MQKYQLNNFFLNIAIKRVKCLNTIKYWSTGWHWFALLIIKGHHLLIVKESMNESLFWLDVHKV